MAIDRTQYNLLVDDAGDGTSGTVVDKNKIKVVLLDPIDSMIPDPVAFTPTIVSSGGGTPTYSVQVARWGRSNGQVFVTGRVVITAFGTLAAGSISIGGLPVASLNVANLYATAGISWNNFSTAAINVWGLVAPNSQVISLYLNTAAATNNLTQVQKTDIAASVDLFFSATYISP
jgi:hypothetical protein